MAFSLMCSAKKGISALQLQKNLDLKSFSDLREFILVGSHKT
jgi:hypothetical protein